MEIDFGKSIVLEFKAEQICDQSRIVFNFCGHLGAEHQAINTTLTFYHHKIVNAYILARVTLIHI